MNWFLYDKDLSHERVKSACTHCDGYFEVNVYGYLMKQWLKTF